jgi:1-deoxy-D-xylulose-5-phosphate synthase
MLLLNEINSPEDIKKLNVEQLETLSNELRLKTIETVSITGGHLGAGLGVVELTIAIHYTFNTPTDVLIWDVGHQAYPHKILTGRKDQITTLRQPGGLAGFTKRDESIYDPFGAGHSSTSISAALGMAVARDLAHKDNEVIAVIGDGAMSAGLAYEAMNNAGSLKKRMIVILNDNEMSIAPAVGAMNYYLSKLISSESYLEARNKIKTVTRHLPEFIKKVLKKFEKNIKDLFNDGNFFEEMGFYYIGPIDGHDIKNLVKVLNNIKNDKTIQKPIMLHVITEKGRGFKSEEQCNEKFHAVNKFNPITGIQTKSSNTQPSYTQVFAETLVKQAEKDEKIVAITAAMPSGTGLNLFAHRFPDRFFDVGIAEQHAVTFAAGLACDGIKPFVAIYSTFLQRAYDQIIHDVAIQKLPVRFAIDRAGFVGADGPTHAGSFDISYLSIIPNMIIMAASNEEILARMIATAAQIDDQPCAFRYPRGIGPGATVSNVATPLEIGKGEVIKQGSQVAILSFGTRLIEALKAYEILKSNDIYITVVDARFAKPLDQKLILDLARNHELIITIEEGSIGGFATQVQNLLMQNGFLDGKLKLRSLFYPDHFIDHSTQELMNKYANLTAEHIIKTINQATKLKNSKIINLFAC